MNGIYIQIINLSAYLSKIEAKTINFEINSFINTKTRLVSKKCPVFPVDIQHKICSILAIVNSIIVKHYLLFCT